MMHDDATAERLALLRIAVFAIWFGRVATTPVTNYTLLPPELIEPVAILRLLPLASIMSSQATLLVIQVATLLACAAGVLGVRPWRPIALVAVALLFFHDGAMKSVQGFVNHAQMAPLYVATLLAFAPAADAWSWSWQRARRVGGGPRRPAGTDYGTAMLLCTTLIGLAYTFIGLRRILHGGLEVFTDGSIVRWVVARTEEYAAYDFELGLAVVGLPGLPTLLAIGMVVVTVAEALTLLALLNDRFRRGWLVVVVGFHLGTLLLMNIFFWENLILLLLLFTRVDPVEVVRRRRGRVDAGGSASCSVAVTGDGG